MLFNHLDVDYEGHVPQGHRSIQRAACLCLCDTLEYAPPLMDHLQLGISGNVSNMSSALTFVQCRVLSFSTLMLKDYRFLLLHDGRHEEGVKAFFTDLHELFTRATLNPLYVDGEPIASPVFSERVLQLARKYL
jgi:Sedlin, N-terminal conserved region